MEGAYGVILMSAVSQFWQGIEMYSLGYTYSLIIHVVKHTCTSTVKLNYSKNNHAHIKRSDFEQIVIRNFFSHKIVFYEAMEKMYPWLL